MEKINYMKKIVFLKSNEKAELAKKISNINKNFNLNQDCYSLLKKRLMLIKEVINMLTKSFIKKRNKKTFIYKQKDKKALTIILIVSFCCFSAIWWCLFGGYTDESYKKYLILNNYLVEESEIEENKDKIIIEDFSFHEGEKIELTENEKKLFDSIDKIYKLKEDENNIFFLEKDNINHLILYKKNTGEKNIFNQNDKIMSINFIQNKYIFISSLSNTYLFDQTNLTLLDSFGKENKRYIMDIYYRNDNNLLYVLSYNDLDKDIYKIDELQIKNNKLELITSLKFHSISRPYNIKYIDDNILLAKSEFINGFEGYSTIIGIEKYDLNYWRNIKL